MEERLYTEKPLYIDEIIEIPESVIDITLVKTCTVYFQHLEIYKNKVDKIIQLAEICSKYETAEDIAVLKEVVSSDTSELEFENLDEAMAVRLLLLILYYLIEQKHYFNYYNKYNSYNRYVKFTFKENSDKSSGRRTTNDIKFKHLNETRAGFRKAN